MTLPEQLGKQMALCLACEKEYDEGNAALEGLCQECEFGLDEEEALEEKESE